MAQQRVSLENWSCDHPRAVIALVHGLGEFCMRYDWAAQRFVEHGYAVVSADLPAHGASARPRGHIRNFNVFLDALDEIIEGAKTLYPGKPVVVFGHSMGGLICVRYAQTRQFPPEVKALVLSSPSLQTSLPIKAATIRTARLISYVWPTLQQPNRISPESVSRSTEIQDFYRTNQDILHKTSIKFLLEFVDAMNASVAQPTSVDIPVFTIQAGEDQLVSVAATTKFHETLSAPAKDFKLYPECYHELLNEPEREQVHDDILAWLAQQQW